MGFESGDDLLKYLKALGLADGDAKPLAAARIDPTSTASGAVQSTAYTLNTVSLAENFLNSAKRGFIAFAALTTAGNANAKTIKLNLGSTALLTLSGSTANAKDVILIVVCIRTAADAQLAMALCLVDGALVAASSILATATEDESDQLDITVTSANTAAAAASATGKGLVVLPLG